MARRRTDKGNALLVFIALVVAAVAVIGPFVIAGWTIMAELRARKFRSAHRASQLITAEEKAEIARGETRLAALAQYQQDILSNGLASGLQQRQDGWFDARNTQARDLNFQLEALAKQEAEVFSAYEALKDRLGARIETWLTAQTNLIGMRVAIVVFVGLFAALTVGRLSEHGDLVNISAVLFGLGTDGSDRIMASAIATAAAGVGMWIARSLSRAALT